MTDPASSITALVRRCSRIAAALTCALLAACAVGEPDESFGTYEGNVVAQLDTSVQALAARGLPLQLISYTPAAPLDTEDAVRAARANLVDAAAIVPNFNGIDATSLRLNTVRERMQAYHAGSDVQNVAANIETVAFPAVQRGQKVLDVIWESDGRQFPSKLIYDESGIVYDNILSNIAVVDDPEVTAELPPGQPTETSAAGGMTAFANQSFSVRFKNITITWIWGGTRGKIVMDHYVISCDGWRSFCDDGGQVDAWMTLGSAEGKTRRNALIKPRISKLAWGYGWATPTASFSITWNPGSLSFSASTSGVGSAGKGSGIHTII